MKNDILLSALLLIQFLFFNNFSHNFSHNFFLQKFIINKIFETKYLNRFLVYTGL